jgi:hypothetical protein
MATHPPTGWPFLIAAGPHRDYGIVLAPDFLVADLDYGFLDEAVRPGGEPRTVEVRSRGGRRLTVVSATHTLAPGEAAATHDEHGRPLRLLYGFVCRHPVADPDPADLAATFAVALEAFRRFLDDEYSPAVMAGQPFAVRSAVTRRLEPAGAPARDAAVVGPVRRRAKVGVAILAAAGLALALLLLLLLFLLPRPRTAPPEPCPSASVALGQRPIASAAPAGCTEQTPWR